jgi:hypothetical protein
MFGGFNDAFAGGRSKPRLSLIGVLVEPLKVARTSAGTTQSAATTTRMAIRARLEDVVEERAGMRSRGCRNTLARLLRCRKRGV